MKTRMACAFASFLLAASGVFGPCLRGVASDWPQLQRDPQRTGRSPDYVGPPPGRAAAYCRVWFHNFTPEVTAPEAQPIIVGGKVLVGTLWGNVHAFKAENGEQLWTAKAGAPIAHTLGAADGKVVAACLDGSINAFDVENGALLWRFDAKLFAGFSAAPCMADSRIYIGNRRGVFFALDLNGKELWRAELEAPLFNSAAWNDGRVFVGAEDCRVYCLDADNGALLWRSERLPNVQSFRSYHPVVHKGHVFLRPMTVSAPWPGAEMDTGWLDPAAPPEKRPTWWVTWDEKTLAEAKLEFDDAYLGTGQLPEKLQTAQDTLERNLREKVPPQFFALDEETGKESFVPLYFNAHVLTGAGPPPAVGPDEELLVPVIYATYGIGRLDMEKNRFIDILIPGGRLNPDENENISTAGTRVFMMHSHGALCGAGISGAIDVQERRWFGLTQSMEEREKVFYDNCCSGNHAAAISDGRFFHIQWNVLCAFEGEGAVR